MDKLNHCVYNTMYHVVWCTHQKKKLDTVKTAFAEAIIKATADEIPKVHIMELKAMPDHIHVLVSIPPKYSISEVVRKLKGKSSYQLKKQFQLNAEKVWSKSYFVGSLGGDSAIQKVKEYIKNN